MKRGDKQIADRKKTQEECEKIAPKKPRSPSPRPKVRDRINIFSPQSNKTSSSLKDDLDDMMDLGEDPEMDARL